MAQYLAEWTCYLLLNCLHKPWHLQPRKSSGSRCCRVVCIEKMYFVTSTINQYKFSFGDSKYMASLTNMWLRHLSRTSHSFSGPPSMMAGSLLSENELLMLALIKTNLKGNIKWEGTSLNSQNSSCQRLRDVTLVTHRDCR